MSPRFFMRPKSRLQSAGLASGSENPVVKDRGWYDTPLIKNWSFVTESKNFVPLIAIELRAQTEPRHKATVRARVGVVNRWTMVPRKQKRGWREREGHS